MPTSRSAPDPRPTPSRTPDAAMFEVGFSEILLIFAIALLVLGPNKLPKLAADIGRWAGRARAMARQLRTQLEQEVQYDPLADTKPPQQTIHAPAPAVVAGAPSPNVQQGDRTAEQSAEPVPPASTVTPAAPVAPEAPTASAAQATPTTGADASNERKQA